MHITQSPISIYLMGQISIKAPETHAWRKRLHDKFHGSPRYNIIDPCNNEFNRSLLRESQKSVHDDKDHCTIREALKVKGHDIIVPKDRLYVRTCDIGIVNLNLYDPDKPLIGTMFELAWFYDQPHKTVIGFYNGDSEAIYKGHPFISKTVTAWVDDEYQAVDLVRCYFGDMFGRRD